MVEPPPMRHQTTNPTYSTDSGRASPRRPTSRGLQALRKRAGMASDDRAVPLSDSIVKRDQRSPMTMEASAWRQLVDAECLGAVARLGQVVETLNVATSQINGDRFRGSLPKSVQARKSLCNSLKKAENLANSAVASLATESLLLVSSQDAAQTKHSPSSLVEWFDSQDCPPGFESPQLWPVIRDTVMSLDSEDCGAIRRSCSTRVGYLATSSPTRRGGRPISGAGVPPVVGGSSSDIRSPMDLGLIALNSRVQGTSPFAHLVKEEHSEKENGRTLPFQAHRWVPSTFWNDKSEAQDEEARIPAKRVGAVFALRSAKRRRMKDESEASESPERRGMLMSSESETESDNPPTVEHKVTVHRHGPWLGSVDAQLANQIRLQNVMKNVRATLGHLSACLTTGRRFVLRRPTCVQATEQSFFAIPEGTCPTCGSGFAVTYKSNLTFAVRPSLVPSVSPHVPPHNLVMCQQRTPVALTTFANFRRHDDEGSSSGEAEVDEGRRLVMFPEIGEKFSKRRSRSLPATVDWRRGPRKRTSSLPYNRPVIEGGNLGFCKKCLKWRVRPSISPQRAEPPTSLISMEPSIRVAVQPFFGLVDRAVFHIKPKCIPHECLAQLDTPIDLKCVKLVNGICPHREANGHFMDDLELTISEDCFSLEPSSEPHVELAIFSPHPSCVSSRVEEVQQKSLQSLKMSREFRVVSRFLSNRRRRLGAALQSFQAAYTQESARWKSHCGALERSRQKSGDEFFWGSLPVRANVHHDQFVPVPAGYLGPKSSADVGHVMNPPQFSTGVDLSVPGLTPVVFNRQKMLRLVANRRADKRGLTTAASDLQFRGPKVRTRRGDAVSDTKNHWMRAPYVNVPGPPPMWKKSVKTCFGPAADLFICNVSSLARVISCNNRMWDPVAEDRNAQMAAVWSFSEVSTFIDKFLMYPKDFRRISSFFANKSTSDCINFYYKNKYLLGIKRGVRDLSAIEAGQQPLPLVTSNANQSDRLPIRGCVDLGSEWHPTIDFQSMCSKSKKQLLRNLIVDRAVVGRLRDLSCRSDHLWATAVHRHLSLPVESLNERSMSLFASSLRQSGPMDFLSHRPNVSSSDCLLENSSQGYFVPKNISVVVVPNRRLRSHGVISDDPPKEDHVSIILPRPESVPIKPYSTTWDLDAKAVAALTEAFRIAIRRVHADDSRRAVPLKPRPQSRSFSVEAAKSPDTSTVEDDISTTNFLLAALRDPNADPGRMAQLLLDVIDGNSTWDARSSELTATMVALATSTCDSNKKPSVRQRDETSPEASSLPKRSRTASQSSSSSSSLIATEIPVQISTLTPKPPSIPMIPPTMSVPQPSAAPTRVASSYLQSLIGRTSTDEQFDIPEPILDRHLAPPRPTLQPGRHPFQEVHRVSSMAPAINFPTQHLPMMPHRHPVAFMPSLLPPSSFRPMHHMWHGDGSRSLGFLPMDPSHVTVSHSSPLPPLPPTTPGNPNGTNIGTPNFNANPPRPNQDNGRPGSIVLGVCPQLL